MQEVEPISKQYVYSKRKCIIFVYLRPNLQICEQFRRKFRSIYVLNYEICFGLNWF